MHSSVAWIALLPFVAGCGIITFDVDQSIPEQRVQGNLVSMLLDGLLENPIPIDIDVEREVAARDAGAACSAKLTSLTLRITESGLSAGDEDDFDFVDSIDIFVESSQNGSRLPRALIATLPSVPAGSTELTLRTTGAELLPYVEEGALISSQASGSPPADDVTFVGAYTIEIEAL